MKKYALFLLVLAIYLICPINAKAQEALPNQDLQAVVRIDAYNNPAVYDNGNGQYQFGTGYFISYEGWIITAAHVLYDIDELGRAVFYQNYTLRQSTGLTSEPTDIGTASLDYYDLASDFAILYYDQAKGKFSHRFAKASVDELNNMQIGEDISALGFPMSAGKNITYTKGTFSGFEYDTNEIKADLSASFGSSGSPLIDKNKKIVGVLTSKDVMSNLIYGTSNVGMKKSADSFLAAEAKPSDCVYNSVLGLYEQNMLYYYDAFCIQQKTDNIEYVISKYYKYKCGTDLDVSLIKDAGMYISSGDTTIAKWREYVDWLCPIKASSVLEKYFIAGQSPDGTLIKSPDSSTIYLVGNDKKKHPFADAEVYNSWKINLENVQLASNEFINSLIFGKSVKYAPGTLVKTDYSPRVYVVGDEGELHWLANENVAMSLFGNNWSKDIKNISEVLFTDYSTGADIVDLSL